MALIVTEKWSNPQSAVQSDDKGQMESDATRVFQMVADSVNYTPVSARYEAMAQGYIPRPGSPHPSDVFLICRQVECNKTAPFFFEVSARYNKSGGDDSDPSLQPPEIEWDFVVTEESIDQDALNKPIHTRLGESFDPPITRPYADLFLRVSKNVVSFNPSTASLFMHRVNKDPFLGFPAGTLLIEEFKATSVITQNLTPYWRRTIGIHVRRGAPNTTDDKAWWRRIRAEGFVVRQVGIPIEADGVIPTTRARDEDGEIAAKPVLHSKLTGFVIRDPAKAEWYEFQIYPTIDFSPLNFL